MKKIFYIIFNYNCIINNHIFFYISSKNIKSVNNSILNITIIPYEVNPNPFDQTPSNADFVLTYTITQAQYISVYIVNFDKNITIKTIFTNWYAGIPYNTYEVHWNGTNSSGQNVKNGQYYFKLVCSAGSTIYKGVSCDGHKTGSF
ncbi:MAG: hypothetical protein H5U37_05210 [Caldisericia bacterium]|nr:hypothetical protein [Caldisericia bacterium]